MIHKLNLYRIVWILLLSYRGLLGAVTLSGHVVDSESGETIIGVNVIALNTELGSSSDVDGFFIISGLAQTESVTIRFSHIGYEEKTIKVNLSVGNHFLSQIRLKPNPVELEAIDVVATRGAVVQRDMDIGSFEADPILLKEIPQLNKDVFNLIKFSPGVTISDEFSPLYNVRGSDPGENLVQLDGMTIYNPQHFLSAEAIFNPYAIKNIELLVGGFDAEFGGRNASILYLTSREGHKEKLLGEFKPSTSGLEGAVEFPWGNVGTAMVSGRGHSDWFTRVILNAPNHRYDLNSALAIKWKRTRFRVSIFSAEDYMDYDAGRFMNTFWPDDTFEDYSVGWLTQSQNLAAGVQSRTILTPKLILETHTYYSGFSVNNHSFMRFTILDSLRSIDQVLAYETRIKNSIKDRTIKAKLVWFTFGRQQVNMGIELNRFRFSNEYGALSSRDFQVNQDADLNTWFIQDKIEWGPILLKVGIRQSGISPSNTWKKEPRASLAYHRVDLSIKFAWGKYYQYLTSMNTQDIELAQSVDYYYPLQNRDPLASEHFILGWEHRISNHWEYSVSAYYKDLSTLYRYDYQNTLKSLLSHSASLEKGTGKAYGIESLLRGKWGRLSGWLTYIYSVSKRQYASIQGGNPFLADGDQTHQLKSLLALKINRDITASTTLQFTSGNPNTWETGMVNHFTYDPLENSIGVFSEYITPVKNNVRFPPRMYVDIGWKKKLRSGFGYRLANFIGSDEAVFTMNIKNILFLHRNPWMYIRLPGEGNYAYDPFSFVPLPTINMGYRIKF